MWHDFRLDSNILAQILFTLAIRILIICASLVFAVFIYLIYWIQPPVYCEGAKQMAEEQSGLIDFSLTEC